MKLNEWKQNELNRLLMEKFNLKEKEDKFDKAVQAAELGKDKKAKRLQKKADVAKASADAGGGKAGRQAARTARKGIKARDKFGRELDKELEKNFLEEEEEETLEELHGGCGCPDKHPGMSHKAYLVTLEEEQDDQE